MKLIKFIIIVLSLSLPIHTYACWDDDWDDDYDCWYDDDNDESWDSDEDWNDWYSFGQDDDLIGGVLDEVGVTAPDNSDQDSFEETDWISTSDNDSWDDGNDDWWDDDYDDNWMSQDSEKEPNVPYSRYYEPDKNEHSLAEKVKLPSSWEKQYKNMNCVSTVLEYVANLLDSSLLSDYQPYRVSFEQIYYEMFSRNLDIYGVNFGQMEAYFKACGFVGSNISIDEIKSSIDGCYPVVATVKNSTESTAHEVLIVSYTDDNTYVAVNPEQGNYQSYTQDDFYYNTFYVLKQYK